MRDRTKDFIKKINQTNEHTTDEEYTELYYELTKYLYTLPQEEQDEFAKTGYGEMLYMCCPMEKVRNYDRDYYLANYATKEEQEEARKVFGLDIEEIIRLNKV